MGVNLKEARQGVLRTIRTGNPLLVEYITTMGVPGHKHAREKLAISMVSTLNMKATGEAIIILSAIIGVAEFCIGTWRE